MIHEMIHVYFNHIGKFGERHGVAFARMARELSAKVGFEIPLTDVAERYGLADESKLKSVGVQIIYRKDGGQSLAIINSSTLQTMLPSFMERWRGILFARRTEFWTVSSLKWTELSHSYPVQRPKVASKVTYYALKDPSWLEDLKTNGTLLAAVDNNPITGDMVRAATGGNNDVQGMAPTE